MHIHVLMLCRKFKLIPIKFGFFTNFKSCSLKLSCSLNCCRYLLSVSSFFLQTPLSLLGFKSESIANFHCKITLLDNGESVYLHKLDGLSFVNQIPVEQDEPMKLSHSKQWAI